MFSQGLGRRGGGTFADSFRVHSVSLLAAEQQRDSQRLEYSDKIILPPSCLEKLAHLEITYPMIFEVTNPRYMARRLHCAHPLARQLPAALPPRRAAERRMQTARRARGRRADQPRGHFA